MSLFDKGSSGRGIPERYGDILEVGWEMERDPDGRRNLKETYKRIKVTKSEEEGMTCEQNLSEGGTCPAPAAYRYTWPGGDEARICEEHSAHMRGVARAMGMHLQLIPLNEEEVA